MRSFGTQMVKQPPGYLHAYHYVELTESTESSVMSTPRSGTPSSQVSNIPDNTVLCSLQSLVNIPILKRSRKMLIGIMTMHNVIEIKAIAYRHSKGDIMLKIDPKIPFRYCDKKLLTTPYAIVVNVLEINEGATNNLSEDIRRQFIIKESTVDFKLLSKEKWLEKSDSSKVNISIKVLFNDLYAEESREDNDFMMVHSAAG